LGIGSLDFSLAVLPAVQPDTADINSISEQGVALENNAASVAEDNASGPDPEGSGDIKRRRLLDKSQCSCSDEVPESWKATVLWTGHHLETSLWQRLSKMIGYRVVHYKHAMGLSSQLGWRIKHPQLMERLRYIYQHRLEIGTLKTSNRTFQLWRRANRPAHPSDALGVYKFPHQNIHIEFQDSQSTVLQNIKEILGINLDIEEGWKRDGTISLPVFEWCLTDPDLERCITDEFDMDRFHQRHVNGRPNFG